MSALELEVCSDRRVVGRFDIGTRASVRHADVFLGCCSRVDGERGKEEEKEEDPPSRTKQIITSDAKQPQSMFRYFPHR